MKPLIIIGSIQAALGVLTAGSYEGLYKCPSDAPEFYSYLPVFESSWDWRQEGVTLRVIDQGQQGGGVLHVAVSGLEAAYQIKYSKVKRFSRQQAFDCVKAVTPGDVYQQLRQAGGIATEEAYPWQEDT